MDVSVVLLTLTATIFYAFGIVLAPLGLRVASPVAGAAVSVPSSALFFLVLAPFTIDFAAWTPNSLGLFVVAGLFFPAAVTLLNFTGNKRLGPNLSGALGNLTPLFAVGLAAVLLGDIPGPWQSIGILAICGGLLLLAAERMRLHTSAALWVLLLPLTAAVFRGAAQPIVKLGLEGWPDAFAATTIGYVMSALVLTIVRRVVAPAPLPRDPRILWYCVIGISNGLSVIFLYAALARGPVTTVAPVMAIYPLAVMALNRAIHGDRSLTRITFLGIVISIAGVALVLVG